MNGHSLNSFLVLLGLLGFISGSFCSSHVNSVEARILKAEEELWEESLPLKAGSRVYKLEGIKPNTWYEVKISYPASMPAFFSLQLVRGDSESGMNLNRRLLNTEKIIFKTESLDVIQKQGGISVLVTVEPEGVVALKNVREREFIIFNIVCNELLLGIPQQVWWVVLLVLLCLVAAFIIPLFLPPYLLPRNHTRVSEHQNDPKTS
ncbi:uncharacterized protein LOC116189525 isoform X2 [Punica granatum]|uniref:Uncharacterized protein LOC116189525 isoform X2 n=1 Tax=Punica granatum TaxID=22663 RepID=A0A6P8C101_PUNGR|nr:uncharacterized protein LOC116189525 isoform X2 [Punica granatum]XP_031375078.1 uncharacterized protein LOC116189525 isoform X2 [Punica granatum]